MSNLGWLLFGKEGGREATRDTASQRAGVTADLEATREPPPTRPHPTLSTATAQPQARGVPGVPPAPSSPPRTLAASTGTVLCLYGINQVYVPTDTCFRPIYS